MTCTVEEAKKKKCVFKVIGMAALFVTEKTRINYIDDTCIADECVTAWRWSGQVERAGGAPKGFCGFGGKP